MKVKLNDADHHIHHVICECSDYLNEFLVGSDD